MKTVTINGLEYEVIHEFEIPLLLVEREGRKYVAGTEEVDQ